MSWDTEMVTIVRYLIGDVDPDTPTYEDDRIATLILIASFQTQLDASFKETYAVNIDNETITPDPTAVRDEAFMSLACIRAAYILSVNEFKTLGNQGIRIKDGESEIDLRRSPETLKMLRDTFKEQYDDKLYLYKLDQTAIGLNATFPASALTTCRSRLPWWAERSC